jgi:hypothetical protein
MTKFISVKKNIITKRKSFKLLTLLMIFLYKSEENNRRHNKYLKQKNEKKMLF